MWLLKRMSVQSFPSPRQNTRGVKWLITDQDLTGPTTASSSGKEWGHAELLTILPWKIRTEGVKWINGGADQNLAPCEWDCKGLDAGRTKYMDLVHLFAFSAKQHSELIQKWKQFWCSVPLPLPGMRVLWLSTAIQSGLTDCWTNGEQTCTHQNPNRDFTTNTLIFSSESAGQSHFRNDGWLTDF